MTNEFMREDRYIVFKVSDVERYLTDKDRANITMMKMEIDAGRDCANKPTFKGLIVEADWPEYEPTWKAIEARVTGAQPAPSFADAYQGAMEEVAIWKKRALEAEDLNRKFVAEINGPTYMGGPAQPAPSVPREFVMDAIAQALGDAYDCTRVWSAWGYGTMSHDDFQLIAEDGDRLSEIADAAIMAMGASAPKPCAQPAPSVQDGWLRAIDEALVVAHVGVANEIDTYEQAKAKLDSLLGFHVDAATDPAVNGGWKLVPRPPTPTMVKAGLESSHVLNVHRVLACYDAMIDAAPEAKP